MADQRYFPYGGVRWSSGETKSEFGFTSQRQEEGFGLYDYSARMYSPVLGRFISPDSIVPEPGGSQGWNRYMYVGGNPLRFTDPTGRNRCGQIGIKYCPEDTEMSRKDRLYQFGSRLRNNLHISDGYEKAKKFLEVGSDLYGNDAEEFVADVTEMIHGYKSEQFMFYSYTQIQFLLRDYVNIQMTDTSSYFLGQGAFDSGYDPASGITCKSIDGICDKGWRSYLVDNSGNQMYHFWFFVAVAYYDGEIMANWGNTQHDGWSLTMEDLFGGADPNDGISMADYRLSIAGITLGKQIDYVSIRGRTHEFKTMTPLEIIEWMDRNVAVDVP